MNRSDTIASLLKSAEKSLSFISKPNKHTLTLSFDQSTRITELSERIDEIYALLDSKISAHLSLERRLEALDDVFRRLTTVEQKIFDLDARINQISQLTENNTQNNLAKMHGLAKAVGKAVNSTRQGPDLTLKLAAMQAELDQYGKKIDAIRDLMSTRNSRC